ncbi:MAG: PQQ-dependent sugar dehydrogenase [Gammaproteobacteria bacterium]
MAQKNSCPFILANANKKNLRFRTIVRVWIAIEFLSAVFSTQAAELPLDTIRLPSGFHIAVFARVPLARTMALSPNGTLYVGTGSKDVYAVRDQDGDHRVERLFTIARGLDQPNGVAFQDGALFVAAVSRILRYDDIERRLDHPPAPVVVTDRLPSQGWHGWRRIAFGPDRWLYIAVGAPCDVCESEDPYATILRMQPDGSALEVFARGTRSVQGMDWSPVDRTLWFSENGRDWLGDDLPSDEVNQAPRAGLHFGFPYCHQGDTPDPEFGKLHPCSSFVPPVVKLGAHVAPMGIAFYHGQMFPMHYHGRLFVAEHGSWNRSTPVGYRVVVLSLQGDKLVEQAVFAEGWLKGREAWGRPMDLLQMPDGALLLSDDKAGAIYRISYDTHREQTGR